MDGTKVTGSHYGMVKLKSANLDEKDGHINSGEFVMDMNSITCDDLTGKWMNDLIGHLKNDDFFGVDKHPTATLKIKHGMMGKLDGSLTIKGKTEPVSFKSIHKRVRAIPVRLNLIARNLESSMARATFLRG